MYDIQKIPLGIYEKALPDAFSWEEKLAAVKLAGFDYIEISVDESDARLARLDWGTDEISHLRQLMEETGIAIPTMCLSGHRRYPFGSKDSTTRGRALEIMEKSIYFACALGIRCIQLAAYDVYYEQADEETEGLFLEGMRRSVELAARAGVILAMEIMDTPFMGTISRATHYLRAIPSPYFKIYPDMGNLTRFSTDVGSELELGLPDMVAIHVKETAPGLFKGVPFGEGTVAFEEIFCTLRRLGYSGMFMVEMWADNSRTSTVEEATATLREARRFVTDKMRLSGYEV